MFVFSISLANITLADNLLFRIIIARVSLAFVYVWARARWKLGIKFKQSTEHVNRREE